jgi:hypothetical protein
MTTPRRIVKIRLSPRDAADSPELLENIAQAFARDDLSLDLTRDSSEAVEPEPVEMAATKETIKTTNAALDLEDQAIETGMSQPEKPQEARRKPVSG